MDILDLKNKKRKLLIDPDKTPQVLLDHIFSYVSSNDKQYLSKELYIKFHYDIRYDFYTYGLITGAQKKFLSDKYIKYILQSDSDFILNVVLLRKKISWMKPKKILYKGNRYKCFLSYLCALAEFYNSQKCTQLIQSMFKEKNAYRNVASYNNKWTS